MGAGKCRSGDKVGLGREAGGVMRGAPWLLRSPAAAFPPHRCRLVVSPLRSLLAFYLMLYLRPAMFFRGAVAALILRTAPLTAVKQGGSAWQVEVAHRLMGATQELVTHRRRGGRHNSSGLLQVYCLRTAAKTGYGASVDSAHGGVTAGKVEICEEGGSRWVGGGAVPGRWVGGGVWWGAWSVVEEVSVNRENINKWRGVECRGRITSWRRRCGIQTHPM